MERGHKADGDYGPTDPDVEATGHPDDYGQGRGRRRVEAIDQRAREGRDQRRPREDDCPSMQADPSRVPRRGPQVRGLGDGRDSAGPRGPRRGSRGTTASAASRRTAPSPTAGPRAGPGGAHPRGTASRRVVMWVRIGRALVCLRPIVADVDDRSSPAVERHEFFVSAIQGTLLEFCQGDIGSIIDCEIVARGHVHRAIQKIPKQGNGKDSGAVESPGSLGQGAAGEPRGEAESVQHFERQDAWSPQPNYSL